MENPNQGSPEAPEVDGDARPGAPARELELARARQRDAIAQVRLLQRRLVEAERSAARQAELEHEIARRDATIVGRDAEIAGLRQRIAAEQERIADLEHRALPRLEAVRADLERENRELKALAAHLRAVNDGVMSSLSWRITRPLRGLKSALRG